MTQPALTGEVAPQAVRALPAPVPDHCGECGKPMRVRKGAIYCSGACRAKASRERKLPEVLAYLRDAHAKIGAIIASLEKRAG